tara:strand:- start:63 stop:329 length:267 start_codon:yes stop_codon:yes gene_type:complete
MDEIEIEVFVHSHYKTGEPIEVDAFSAKGEIDLVWLFHVFDKDHIWHADLAADIYEVVQCTEKSIWIKCKPIKEGTSEDWWIDNISKI